MSTALLPVLVYGTLRPMGGNYEYFLGGRTVSEQDVVLDGFTMYGGGGCPFLAVGDRQIVATLVHLTEDEYVDTMKGLDFLEGYRGPGDPFNGYERILHTFTLDGEEIQAWIYVASDRILPSIIESTPVLEGGDWIAHVQAEDRKYGVIA
jgi:gamma-glutamylcyclotransferase (GGCT)/AIG2-like uncharacterized protein YtfP